MIALLASMLLLGVVHGLGPDHCIAVSALAAQKRHREVARVAFRFGLAHAGVLFLFAGALLAFGLAFTERFEKAGEIANGVLLILLGVGLAFDRIGKGLTFHTHLHQHGGQPNAHAHAHVHRLQRPTIRPGRISSVRAVAPSSPEHLGLAHAHDHGRSAWAVGALFAFSGIRNAAMALPAALQGSLVGAGAALACFGLGVIGSMVAYGLLFGLARDWAQRRGLSDRTLRLGLGAVSAGFGCFWIALA